MFFSGGCFDRSGDMPEEIKQSESKKIDLLFGRDLDIKGQFKDRLILEHLKRDKRKKLENLNEPSESLSGDNYDE
jgi:hypothetical protein